MAKRVAVKPTAVDILAKGAGVGVFGAGSCEGETNKVQKL